MDFLFGMIQLVMIQLVMILFVMKSCFFRRAIHRGKGFESKLFLAHQRSVLLPLATKTTSKRGRSYSNFPDRSFPIKRVIGHFVEFNTEGKFGSSSDYQGEIWGAYFNDRRGRETNGKKGHAVHFFSGIRSNKLHEAASRAKGNGNVIGAHLERTNV
ncbi:hypothetical protein VN24_06815 [Paenibacillus beijingensis]|uniref:Uncharacterized protein n=1 Tax=Paenibacillus beijingensis TaxID=1126833 RepID=A0A0D5NHE5_9BACL|nr:hypothetical protein VN24_06815 [Paenibacillus beijingensis]